MRKILRAIFLSKNDDIYYNFSLSIVVFFILRSIFENSFALLSIDYLLIFSSIIYIEFIEIKKVIKNENFNNSYFKQ